MPKFVKLHTGERLDLPDLVHGTSVFTQESVNFISEKELIDNRARISDGFRVRIEDQGTFPGQITVYNGVAINRAGQVFTNEDTPDDSRSTTLQGLNTTFYVEVELATVTGDSDARYFWDPTEFNSPPIPNGSEFMENVATRVASDWRIVRPVSTTGFEQSSNPNSLRVPVAVLRTDGANVIDVGANPGLLLVNPVAIVESDVPSGTTSFRVLDGRILPPVPFDISFDFGSGIPEARTVSTHDKVNDILTLSAALTNAHPAGAVVQVTNPLVYFAAQNKDPSDPVLNPLLATPGHPDMAQRLWQANEVRGSALMVSQDYPGARDDLSIHNIKDQVDHLAAQLRELKFGSPRPEIISTAPPASFPSRPRWYDRAGSVQGARTATFTIGNGTTTFGDFNGTTEAPFLAALSALPASGGVIFVKPGTYTFANTVTVAKAVTFLGSGTTNTSILNANAAGAAFTLSIATAFENIAISQTGAGLQSAIDVTANITVSLDRCLLATGVRINNVQASFRAYNCVFTFSPAASAIFLPISNGILAYSVFDSCTFTAASSAVISTALLYSRIVNSRVTASVVIVGSTAGAPFIDVQIANNTINGRVFASANTQSVAYLNVVDNAVGIDSLTTSPVIDFAATALLQYSTIKNNKFIVTGNSGTSSSAPGTIVRCVTLGDTNGLEISGNTATFPALGYTVFTILDMTGTSAQPIQVCNNTIRGGNSLVRLGSPSSNMTNGYFLIDGNTHNNDGLTEGAIGIDFYEGASVPGVYSATIRNNTFINYTGSTGSPVYGVKCIPSAATANISVDENEFRYLGNNVYSSTVIAVYVPPLSASTGTLSVCNNKIFELKSDGDILSGIYLNPDFAGNTTQYSILNNTISSVVQSDATTTSHTSGIHVVSLENCTISGNKITTVASASPNADCCGILLSNCGSANNTGLIVANNTVFSCRGGTGAAVTLGGTSIKMIGNVENVKITGNICSQANATVGTGSRVPNVIYAYSDSIRHLTVANNICTTSSVGGVTGISIQRINTSAAHEDIVIQGNTVVMNWVGIWKAISVTAGGNSSGISVVNNIVREYALGDNHIAIEVAGHNAPAVTRNVTIRGNTLAGMKTGALTTNRVGIRLLDCERTNISDNNVDWSHPAVAEGDGIYLGTNVSATLRQFVVSGNQVSPDASAGTSEIFILIANVLDGIAIGNSLGNGINTGLLTPAVAAGNWTYTANNKLS